MTLVDSFFNQSADDMESQARTAASALGIDSRQSGQAIGASKKICTTIPCGSIFRHLFSDADKRELAKLKGERLAFQAYQKNRSFLSSLSSPLKSINLSRQISQLDAQIKQKEDSMRAAGRSTSLFSL